MKTAPLRMPMLTLFSAFLFLFICQSNLLKAQSAEVLKSFSSGPHLGTLKDALVGITVTNTAGDGTVQVRHGNGLMLRCDGFVLAPVELFNTRNSTPGEPTVPKQSVIIVVHPGTAQELTVKGRRPGWDGFVEQGKLRQHLGYAVLKIDNLHCSAMRVMLPDSLQPEDTAQIAWSAWDETTRHFQAMRTQTVKIGNPLTAPAGIDIPSLFLEQNTRFEPRLPAVTPGALVLGPENLVVGIVPGNKTTEASVFANFRSFHLATNCVTPLPAPDAAFKQENMVAVPGGPIHLPKGILDLQLDMENSSIGCVAPFLIDKYEVTNEQYLVFWKSLSEKMHKDPAVQADMYPFGWGPPDSPFPHAMAQVPVLGVRLPGARAFAKWSGKRLPTPYEWCLAAFGPDGGNIAPAWGRQFIEQRNAIWEKIVAAHTDYARQHPEIMPKFEVETKAVLIGDRDFILQPVISSVGSVMLRPRYDLAQTGEFFHLPWFFFRQGPDFAEATLWSKQTVETLAEPLFDEWIDPTYVLPVGSRPYDVSPYGAFDMVMNAKELVVPGPIFPWNRPPAPDWPSREIDRYIDIQWLLADPNTGVKSGVDRIGAGGSNLSQAQMSSLQDKLEDTEAILHLYPFVENNLSWHNPNGIISHMLISPYNSVWSAGKPVSHYYAPTRMSRRIRTASENARPGDNSTYCADLGAYMPVFDSIMEYSEVIRPVEQMVVGLQAGPTFEMASATGTTLHKWALDKRTAVMKGKDGRPYLSYLSEPTWFDDAHSADATLITQFSSYAAWTGKPKHYHDEMGRPTGKDHDRAFNKGAFIAQSKDTYLVAGGFRCVR